MQYRRQRPSLFDQLAVRFRINFWRDGWCSISPSGVEGLHPWVWSYPVLQSSGVTTEDWVGPDPPILFRPLLRLAQIRWKVFLYNRGIAWMYIVIFTPHQQSKIVRTPLVWTGDATVAVFVKGRQLSSNTNHQTSMKITGPYVVRCCHKIHWLFSFLCNRCQRLRQLPVFP